MKPKNKHAVALGHRAQMVTPEERRRAALRMVAARRRNRHIMPGGAFIRSLARRATTII